MKGPFREKTVALGAFRGAVDASLGDPTLLEAIADPAGLMSRGRVFHAGRNRLAAVELPASPRGTLPAVLKEFRPRGIDRLKTLLFPSKAARAWRGAAALQAAGIPTPRPLAYLERRRAGMMIEGYFLAERVDGGREVREDLRSLGGPELDRFLVRLAEFLGICHRRGVLHRDLSDGNILVVESGRGGSDFFLLDTNRVRRGARVKGLRAAGNLVRLGIPARSRAAFLSYYHAGRAVPWRFGAWYRFRKAWYTAVVRTKKALRLRKLSRKLGVQ